MLRFKNRKYQLTSRRTDEEILTSNSNLGLRAAARTSGYRQVARLQMQPSTSTDVDTLQHHHHNSETKLLLGSRLCQNAEMNHA
ncbi:hypothetical protein NNRS527_01487 [Nitrosospira sp. NRS527]|nr:hypothetical protein NNRS527_01487 [Nitrosospira sp. NRS527]